MNIFIEVTDHNEGTRLRLNVQNIVWFRNHSLYSATTIQTLSDNADSSLCVAESVIEIEALINEAKRNHFMVAAELSHYAVHGVAYK